MVFADLTDDGDLVLKKVLMRKWSISGLSLFYLGE